MQEMNGTGMLNGNEDRQNFFICEHRIGVMCPMKAIVLLPLRTSLVSLSDDCVYRVCKVRVRKHCSRSVQREHTRRNCWLLWLRGQWRLQVGVTINISGDVPLEDGFIVSFT